MRFYVSFTFRSRLPFHPAKLHAALNRATASLNRGEGFGSGASATKKEKKSKKSKRKEKEQRREDGESRRLKAREVREEWERKEYWKTNDGSFVCACIHPCLHPCVRVMCESDRVVGVPSPSCRLHPLPQLLTQAGSYPKL